MLSTQTYPTPASAELAELIPAVVYTAAMTATGDTLYVNSYIQSMLGFTPDEWLADPSLWYRQLHEADRERISRTYRRLQVGDGPVSYAYRIHRRDGGEIWVRDSVRVIEAAQAGGPLLLGVMLDISSEMAARETLLASKAKFRALTEQAIAGIYMIDGERGNVAYVNPYGARIFGYDAEELIGLPLSELVDPQSWPDIAAALGRPCDGSKPQLRREFVGRRKNGTPVAVGAHASLAEIGGKPMIIGMVQDITEKKRDAETIRRQMERLEEGLTATIKVMSRLVELRDPYTYGHQHRVAAIGAAIAAEMGFDEHVQRGLRVAGMLHDIGKIGVPAEILAKPARLTPEEFELVKRHAQQGYEILRAISFPWPVAEVALQHHERLDGSGYPQGLKGDEMLLDARIIAVADVLDSMASHRPYRAALGIDAALSEIEANAGRLYDPNVSAACLRLFRERGYALPA